MPISIAAHASPQLSPKCNSQKQLSGGYPCIAFIYIAFPLIILYFHHLYPNVSFLSLYTSQYYSTTLPNFTHILFSVWKCLHYSDRIRQCFSTLDMNIHIYIFISTPRVGHITSFMMRHSFATNNFLSCSQLI